MNNITIELVNNRTSDYICFDCLEIYRNQEKLIGSDSVVTMHINNCGLCNNNKPVIHIRNANYLHLNVSEGIKVKNFEDFKISLNQVN